MGRVEGGTLIKSNPEGVRRQLGLDLAPTKRLLPELAGNPLKGQSLTFKYSLRLEQRNKSVVGNFSGNLVDSVVPYGFIY